MTSFIENTGSSLVKGALIIILAVAAILMGHAAISESAIVDELAHIPAGYGYVRYLDFRLNPEHPPLLKALSAFPLLALQPAFPTDHKSWQTEINGQWEAGWQFLYNQGNDADTIVRVSRIAPVLLTLLLILLVYVWSAELLGRAWALLPTVMVAWSPHFLAHGHYVTTDVAATFGIVLATWRFVKFLEHPSRRTLFYAGLAFGIAQLSKFSAVLLIPFFVFLILVFLLASIIRDWNATEKSARFRRFALRAFRYARATAFIMAIGYAFVIYPVYALFTANYPVAKQVSDTTAILTSFAGGPTPAEANCNPMRCIADLTIAMSHHGITRPIAEYNLGVLMVLQRSLGGNTSYFLGSVSAAGSRLYFPIVYLLKESLPVLIIVLTALTLGIIGIIRRLESGIKNTWMRFMSYLELNFAEFAMLSFVIMYWAYTIRSPLNIGFRHLFPTLPFIYILAAGSWKRVVTPEEIMPSLSFLETIWRRLLSLGFSSVKLGALTILLIWFAIETAVAAPHFLSSFNEFAGGKYGGYRIVTDSNYDWGQDLLRLKTFVEAHPEIDKIAVDYFGAGYSPYYLPGKAEEWRSSKGDPRAEGIRWLAVSANSLQNSIQPTAPGYDRLPEDEYRWLTAIRPQKSGMGNIPEPDFRVGTSIFVYKLSD